MLDGAVLRLASLVTQPDVGVDVQFRAARRARRSPDNYDNHGLDRTWRFSYHVNMMAQASRIRFSFTYCYAVSKRGAGFLRA